MRHDIQPAVLLLGPIAHGDISLPIAGTRICAGFSSPADDFLDGEIDLARILTPNRAATFLWRVAGHSMKETGIHDGDVVVVDRSRKLRHGDVVVASINGAIGPSSCCRTATASVIGPPPSRGAVQPRLRRSVQGPLPDVAVRRRIRALQQQI